MAIAWRHENKVKLSAHLSSAICWQHFARDSFSEEIYNCQRNSGYSYSLSHALSWDNSFTT